MSTLIIQNLRDKLQSRFRRLSSVQMYIFSATSRQFLYFLESNNILKSIMTELLLQYPNHDDFNRVCGRVGKTDSESAVIGYRIVEWLSRDNGTPTIQKIASLASTYEWAGNSFDYYDNARKLFLDPFYEFLDEKLETQKATLSLLLRYQHRSEWFYRNHLYKLYKDETDNKTRQAEKLLALDLYAYLFEQGLEFTIEPSSIDGEIDLIEDQKPDDRLLADAKIFDNKSRGKSYIREGFNQIFTYTKQYNEPFGYLIIYNVSNKHLCFALEATSQHTPYITYSHKTVFFIVIDIHQHTKPVSQRGKFESVEITEQDLIRVIVEKSTNEAEEKKRPFGLAKDEFVVPDDFDAPLPEETLQDFEGK